MAQKTKKKTETKTSSAEEMTFQAEVGRLLDIVANSLYSQREVFLRELISNASDACDKLRYAALTQPELTRDDPEFRIELTPDAQAGVLSVRDNGIGMNRDDLVENLGTIARSGTLSFLEQARDSKDEINLIGQFGVGFYAAFMVADEVEVLTRRAGDGEGWRWVSDGRSGFTVEPSDAAPARGTEVRLKLKDDAKDFLGQDELRRVVRAYSDHIAVPIRLSAGEGDEPEQLNSASALWTRPKSEIAQQQYTEFYHHVARAFDEPWLTLHFKAEGVVEYTGLLFIPSSKPFDLFHPERKHHVKLYVKRVFITDDCDELVPAYLRFLRGVIDSEDLPLNISREVLQHNPVLRKIRQAVTRRVIGELEKKAEKAPEDYAAFWETFGAVLKEGLYEDAEQRESLLGLARFRSTASDGWVSLADYVARMKEGQKAIYYISGDDLDALSKSPQLEGFRARGVEVLLMTDPVDDFWAPTVGRFGEHELRSVTRGAGEDLKDIKAGDETGDDASATSAEGVDELITRLKTALEGEVKDVRISHNLTESPVCLVAAEGDMDIHLERLLRQHGQLDKTSARVLEVNPRHPVIRGLAARLEGNGEDGDGLADAAHLLLDQARIMEGDLPADRAAFARRLSEMMTRGIAG